MVFRGSIGGTAPQCDLEPERWLNGWRPANPRLDPTLRTGEPFGPAPMGADVEMAPISSRRAAGRSGGPVVQWSERAAHNGVVAGSNPAGPTNLLIDRLPRARGAGRYGLDIRPMRSRRSAGGAYATNSPSMSNFTGSPTSPTAPSRDTSAAGGGRTTCPRFRS